MAGKVLKVAAAGLMSATLCSYFYGKIGNGFESSDGLVSRALGYERHNSCTTNQFRTAEDIGLGEGPNYDCTLFSPQLSRRGYGLFPEHERSRPDIIAAKVAHPLLELSLEALLLIAGRKLSRKKQE